MSRARLSPAITDEVLVRNSNRPGEAPQRFTYAEWEFFTRGAKLGVFDLA
ncbi:DUF397 domain-containing protein [Saccharothrix algeriensis]|uniref:DUF397 domain-containing protein n=1 Tax=Saccharothrix algeriensis TaxID=173560 RepID=A0ABS2S1D6_9PSEU|nr:DUF397 domain-containing protein [Saccharothrix algeriensis]MBM7810047.1 hypothetical protein [Saccharothrix algeriensis]